MKVVLLGPLPSLQRDRLQGLLGPGHDVEAVFDDAPTPERQAALADAEVLVSNRFDASFLPMPRLRMLQSPSAGLELIDLAVIPDGVTVCAGRGHESAMAEYVLCTMLDHAIGYRQLATTIEAGHWHIGMWTRGPVHAEIAGRTIGLVGYGAISQEVARRASAMGMKVRAISRWSNGRTTDTSVDETFAWNERDAFLTGVSFLVVTLPSSTETNAVVDQSWFAAMPPDAVLINVSRGGVVDEASLYAALKSGMIGGATLDVWYRYPTDDGAVVPVANHPFHELPNVVMTPHASGRTGGTFERRWTKMADNITNLATNGPFTALVVSR